MVTLVDVGVVVVTLVDVGVVVETVVDGEMSNVDTSVCGVVTFPAEQDAIAIGIATMARTVRSPVIVGQH